MISLRDQIKSAIVFATVFYFMGTMFKTIGFIIRVIGTAAYSGGWYDKDTFSILVSKKIGYS